MVSYSAAVIRVHQRKCLASIGGSEEKEPGEDRHKEGDASGSKEGQTQSSSLNGNSYSFSMVEKFHNEFFLLYMTNHLHICLFLYVFYESPYATVLL